MTQQIVAWRDPSNYDITVQSVAEFAHSQGLILPEKTPDWVVGACVDYSNHYDSSISMQWIFDPAIEKELEREHFGNGWEYHKDIGAYISVDDKGLCDCHYAKPLYEDPKLGWVTPQENGYGGRHFKIKMKDGRDATLRGPWHGGTPKGYHECFHGYAKIDVEGVRSRPSLFMFGLYLKSELHWRLIMDIVPGLVVVTSQQKGTYDTANGPKAYRTVRELAPADMPFPKVTWSKEYKDALPRYPVFWK